MNRERIREIILEALISISKSSPSFPPPGSSIQESDTLAQLGITASSADILTLELKMRLGFPINFWFMLANQEVVQEIIKGFNSYTTVGHMISHILGTVAHQIKHPTVVYVDDEEENLFVFRRRYQSRMALVTFTDPLEAREFILGSSEVVLVITDEMMPGLSGNALRDEIHREKPFMKFILITGNPQNDGDLMYRSLRNGRFYDFIQKPLDYERKGEDYFFMFNRVISGEFF